MNSLQNQGRCTYKVDGHGRIWSICIRTIVISVTTLATRHEWDNHNESLDAYPCRCQTCVLMFADSRLQEYHQRMSSKYTLRSSLAGTFGGRTHVLCGSPALQI
jgi:hypothetical protein